MSPNQKPAFGIDLRRMGEQCAGAGPEETGHVDLGGDAVVDVGPLEPVVVERRLAAQPDERLVDGDHAGPRPGRVVQLRRLVRLTGIRIPAGVTGALECQHRDVVDAEVVGVRVPALVVAVGDDDLGLGAADDRHQTSGRLVEVGLVERLRVLVRLGIRHPRVAVAEHHDLVEADDLRRRGELGAAHRRDLRLLVLGAQPVQRLSLLPQQRVLQLALLAPGAADEHGVDPSGVVLGDRRRTLRRLVVRMGVYGQQCEALGHRAEAIGTLHDDA